MESKENKNLNIDFKSYDLLPFPVIITKDWNIVYLNSEAKNFFLETIYIHQNLLEFLPEEQKNFLKYQMLQIAPNRYYNFSLLLEIKNKHIPVILSLQLLKDQENQCYFIIIINKIDNYDEKFKNLNTIVLETFLLTGIELYKNLLKKICEYYNLDIAFILIKKALDSDLQKNSKDTYKVLSYHKKEDLDLDIHSYELSEKLEKRLEKYGTLIVESNFYKQYPEDLFSRYKVERFIGLKININQNEKLFFITFSRKKDIPIEEIHFTLNVSLVKIISEYIREHHYNKYENFYNIFLNTNEAVFIYNIEKDKVIDCNPAFYKLLHVSPEKVYSSSIFDLIGTEYGKRYKKIFWYNYHKNKYKNGKIRLYISNIFNIKIPVELSVTFIKRNKETIMIGIIRDLTYTIQALEEHRKYLQTLSLLNLHVIELDPNLNLIYINYIPNSKFPKLQKNQNFLDIILEDYKEYVKIVLENLFKTKRNIRIRFPIGITKTRNEWYEADFVYISNKKENYIRGIIKNITLEYIAEKQFILIAEHDLLTSLPNRNRLEEDLYKAILRADKNRSLLAIGFLDLDKFFHINELLGHRFGDLILSLFAERLRQIPEISNSVYRWGGDQFVFFIENIYNKSDINEFLEHLKSLSKEPMIIEGKKFFVTYSVGISLYPIDGMTIDSLFGEADKAMNYAKQHGRFQFIFASNIPKKSIYLNKFEVQSHVLEAISEKKVIPYFQPIYDIYNNKIAGMESLARLPQLQKEMYIGPDIFIPVAEDLGLIEELSYYIIKKSLEFYKELKTQYNIYTSINISRRLLHSDVFIMNLFTLQRDLELEPGGIVIEVTESLAMLDKESSLKKLHQLKEIGYSIAIDDFGTGYSSLGELQELPVDIIKIDKLFIKKLKYEEHNRILDAIILLAQNLNLEIIAEGVEDIDILKKLKKMGIRYAQGFLFAPPLIKEDFIQKLKSEQIINYNYFI